MDDMNKIPKFLWKELLDFLNKQEIQLLSMLEGSSIMIEGGGYQIPIHSVSELYEIRKYLEDQIK
jgi:hypothetical protein